MKVTVRQLKELIREAAAEAMDEVKKAEEEGKEMDEAKAFRAGYQRGVKAASTRKAKR